MVRAVPAPSPAPVPADIYRDIYALGFISGDILVIHDGKPEFFRFHVAADFHFSQNIRVSAGIAVNDQLVAMFSVRLVRVRS